MLPTLLPLLTSGSSSLAHPCARVRKQMKGDGYRRVTVSLRVGISRTWFVQLKDMVALGVYSLANSGHTGNANANANSRIVSSENVHQTFGAKQSVMNRTFSCSCQSTGHGWHATMLPHTHTTHTHPDMMFSHFYILPHRQQHPVPNHRLPLCL